ncbi:MAG: hypothetical protein HY301_19820 [Verrucomicrobia bacterium]|nr:hypothetical protein [Verrucomicrobiota bacterium]
MKTLTVIAKQPGLAAAIRTVVDPTRYRVVALEAGADPASAGGTDAFILDADLTDVRPIRLIEVLRQRMPGTPILVYAGHKQWDWEEDAYLLGVEFILAKPVRARLLNALLDRALKDPPVSALVPAARPPGYALETQRPPEPLAAARSLEPFRQFTRVLTHSLDSAALLANFLQLLRELMSVNRAAIFLTPPPNSLFESGVGGEPVRLLPSCAIGINTTRLQNFELGMDRGIGRHLYQWGRILRFNGPEAAQDPQIAREFERLGAQVAIPILDRESMIGVALFDGRLTGEPLGNEELSLLFRLLEELGLAIKNSWDHDKLSTNHEVMSDILGELGAGCLVISRNLVVLHANARARKFLLGGGATQQPLEFSQIPPIIGSRIFEALNTGAAAEPFKFRQAEADGGVYQLTITPFRRQSAPTINAVLVMIEDHSQIEKSQKLEVEASNLRLVKAMAEGMAHEIGNCLVPLSTHQQLLEQKFDDPEFRTSLTAAMGEGVRRISRLSNQMLFLTRDGVGRAESFAVTQLVEEAFRDVQNSVGDKNALLLCESGGKRFTLTANKPALKHAISELILNALQASPSDPQVQVNLVAERHAGREWLRVDVHDTGKGFSPDSAKRAAEPFYTTRNVGLGLGLTVAKKIVEAHGGRLEIAPGGQSNIVALFLPLEAQPDEPVSRSATRAAAAPKGKSKKQEAEFQE